METGENLVKLMEILCDRISKVKPKPNPTMRIHKIQNAKIGIDMAREERMDLTNISAEDIVNGSQKIIHSWFVLETYSQISDHKYTFLI
jgi:hypothetical protein